MHSLLFVVLTLLAQDKAPTPPPAPAPAQTEKPAEKPAEKPTPPPTQETTFKSLSKQITLGGQIRTRAEYRDPTSYANNPLAASNSDDIFLTRIRLNFNFSVNDDVSVFVQPQDQRVWGQEASVLNDERNMDVHQGFVEVKNLLGEQITIKAGRMELQYGDQRLISPLDWSNIGRAWDGAKLKYAQKDWWVEGFYTVIKDPLPVVSVPGLAPAPGTINGAAEDQDFMGVYFSYIGIENHELDVYAFFREFQDNTFVSETGVTGNLVDHTVGARIKGKLGGLDYTAEAISQGGHQASDRIEAYGLAATLGYTFDMAWTPRIGLEYTHASGDRQAGDGKRNTFDPLFPFNHYYQGFIDTVGWRNSKDLALLISVKPSPTVSIHLDLHAFALAENTDAWYTDNGTVLRLANPAASRQLGNEFDLHARVTIAKNVKFWGGWSHFFAGQHVRDTATTGSAQDMDWFFLQMVVDF